MTFDISSAELRRAIERTKIAAGESTSKYMLDGVLLEMEERHVRLIATDAHRLAVYELANSENPWKSAVFLRQDSLAKIAGYLHDEQGELSVSVTPTEIELQGKQARIVLPAISPRFPDWKKVMPDSSAYASVSLQSDAVLVALVKSYSGEGKGEAASTRWSFSKTHLKLTPSTSQQGVTSEIPIAFGEKSVEVNLDPRYTIPLFRLLDSSEQLNVLVLDSSSAVVFAAGNRYKYVLMPLVNE